MIFAHRGMPGPLQNTRSGVKDALEMGYHGLAVDVVLSGDGVAVISPELWLDAPAGGGGRGPLIWHLPWVEIRRGTVGGQEPMALTELLALLAAYPEVSVYLDVRIAKKKWGLTARPKACAERVWADWSGAGLPNPVYLEAASPNAARRLRKRFGSGAQIYLSWTRHRFDEDDAIGESPSALAARWDLSDAVGAVQEYGLEGYTVPDQLVTDRELARARAAGVRVVVFGVRTAVRAGQLDAMGAHVLVSHGPGLPLVAPTV